MVSLKFYFFCPQEVKKMQNIDELESFLLKHGENIVDMLGGEIDRIELKLKVEYFLLTVVKFIVRARVY